MEDEIDENREDFEIADSTSSEKTENESKNNISADLIRGHINTIILRTLYDRDKYGYEIINEIEEKSHGQYSLKQPTLYSALKRLESQGYIRAYWKTDEVTLGGRRKYFTLTESGKEITEKNQAEWEYSRTVIDNLISDRSFDFSQPAPTPVDFKILKKSTSRVPHVKSDDDEVDEYDDLQQDGQRISVTEQQIFAQTYYNSSEPYVQFQREGQIFTNEPSAAESANTEETDRPQATNANDYIDSVTARQIAEQAAQQAAQQTAQQIAEQAAQQAARQATQTIDEDERRRTHENFLRLMSSPAKDSANEKPNIVPNSEAIDTDKLIYNNKPETERDYKNLINGLFNKAIKPSSSRQQIEQPQANYTVNYSSSALMGDSLTERASADGLKIYTSTYSNKRSTGKTRNVYDRGATFFKCSAIIGIIMLLEFVICLLFKDSLKIEIGYPFVIFSIALAQFAVFAVMFFTGYGKNCAKPITKKYISISVVVTIVVILIIAVVSLLLDTDFTKTNEVMAKLIIPCIVSLNIPIFTASFYLFTK